MFKKILFSLAALSIYANAINCLEAYFKTKPVDYYVPEDYVLDSLYRAPAEGADSKPWSKKYYYTPGNSLPDSLVLMDSKDTVKTVFHYTQEADTLNGMITLVINNDGELFGMVKYMKVADDMHPYAFYRSNSGKVDTLNGYVNLKDEETLVEYKNGEFIKVLLDKKDPNVCHIGNPDDEKYVKITYEALGQTIHLTEENTSTVTEMFFIPLYPQEETIGIRKIRPAAANIKKFQYFDLLGRPAVNKHSVQIRK